MPGNWIDTTADLLCSEINELGMTAPRDAAVHLLAERVSVIAAALHVSEVSARRYLDTATIRDMARDLDPGAVGAARTCRAAPRGRRRRSE